MNLPCCACGKCDSRTNTGGLFCHSCHANASELAKDALFSAYVSRMASLQKDLEDWEQAA